MIRNTVFLVVILFFSCTKTDENEDLSISRAVWNAKNLNNYEFKLAVSCFCPETVSGPHLIKVVNDTIASVNDQPYDPSTMGMLLTIDGIFTFIETSMARSPYKKTLEFDSFYGYPRHVYFDFSKTMADEEIGYQVSDFKIL